MTPLQIIGSCRSSYTWAVRMACEEKGVAYELIETPLRDPELSAVHPFGKMPVMRHGAVALFESKAMATYVDRAFEGPPLFPPDPVGAALAEQWISFVNTLVDPTLVRTYLMAYLAPGTADGSPNRERIAAAMPAMHAQLAALDGAVAATGHLVCGAYTFADINLLPVLDRTRQAPEGAEALAACPNLAAYLDRHAQRPAFQRTYPPGPPGRRQDAS
jgi:glutathione S-transferase